MKGDNLRAPAGPGTVAELRSTFAAGAKALGNAPTVSVSGAASAPPAGSLEHAQAQRRQLFATAPDLRTAARQRVDATWAAMLSDIEMKFGRSVTLNEWDQRDAGAEIGLRRARSLESEFIAIASAPGTSKQAFREALKKWCAAVASYLNTATDGWKPVRKGA